MSLRNFLCGARDGNRTRITSLEGWGNEPLYDTRSFLNFTVIKLVEMSGLCKKKAPAGCEVRRGVKLLRKRTGCDLRIRPDHRDIAVQESRSGSLRASGADSLLGRDSCPHQEYRSPRSPRLEPEACPARSTLH